MTAMAHIKRNPVRHLILVLMALTILLSACGRSDSTTESSEPVAQPGDANGSQTDPTPLPIPTTDTTNVPAPAAPAPTTPAPATPAPAPTSPATPAAVPPKPTPTTAPPAAPVSQPQPVTISCTISPQRTVKVGERLTFTAVQNPANAQVNYTFDHGDGTLDHTAVSKAHYNAPGVYAVKLRWSHGGKTGTVACGNVTVERAPAPAPTPTNPDCYLGHGAADEPVWWCGGKICVANAPHAGCPGSTPGQAPDCYLGHGAADEPVWWCGGKICVPDAPHAGCPTTAPQVSIACTIAPQRTVRPGEQLTFSAVQSPANAQVNYTFDHGDGTLDHTSTSKAHYEAPGVYQVKLRWSHAGQTGTILCGTVTVDGFVPTPVFNANDYIGKTRAQAEATATQKGFASRVIRIDTETFPGTTDHRTDRVNFSIDFGVVTGVTVG